MKPRIPARFAARALPLLVSAVLVAGFMLLLPSVQPNVPVEPARSAAGPSAQSGSVENQLAAEETPGPYQFSPISVDGAPAPGTLAVTAPGAPAFGQLVYSDFVEMEKKARKLLLPNLQFREDISPYRSSTNFDQLVRQFDKSGFTATYTDTISGTMTLQARIDSAVIQLGQARDLYAYLLAAAPQNQFRADTTNYKDLCGQKENPNPPGPNGTVLPPVIDWCDFGARLRQSVREAANIRMIFGQQFMVDASGLHFSGTKLVGGEEAVRLEVAKLHAAQSQFSLAENVLTEGLTRRIATGCVVSDYYTQTEWALLSQAMENEETAQHEIAVRTSYLGQKEVDLPTARAQADRDFRQAAIDGHAKMVRMAAMTRYPAGGFACGNGEPPSNQFASDMAQTLLETRNRARDMAEGRNIFGLDVTFTPDRPYRTSGSTEGLWDEADQLQRTAAGKEADVIKDERTFDQTQQELRSEITAVKASIDTEIANASGCSAISGKDPEFFGCVDRVAAELRTCQDLVTAPVQTPDAFRACMDRKDGQGNYLIPSSDARQVLEDLRGQYVTWWSIYTRAKNIDQRIAISKGASAKVTKWLTISGIAQTASDVSGAIVGMIGAMGGTGQSIAAGIFGTVDIAAKATAGALSTMANVEMEDANNYKEIQNMLLDQSELLIDAMAANQAMRAKIVEFDGIVGGLPDLVSEAQRQRAYLLQAPGNDPAYRMLRDSERLEFATALGKAAEVSYLAARRAEYEYAARLSANKGFRISDIYRARSAGDVRTFLDTLKSLTNSLPSSSDAKRATTQFNISIAQNVLGWTDEALKREGVAPAGIEAERTRRFKAWVARNTVPNNFEDPLDGKPVLRFSFTTSLLDGAVFSSLIPQGFSGYWLVTAAGEGAPKADNDGVSLKLLTTQTGLSYQAARVIQAGTTHFRSQAGCVFDYKLIAPAFMLGLDWPKEQNGTELVASLHAYINDDTKNGNATPVFQGRPVSATEWRVLVFAGSPVHGADMDLQQLTDIVLHISATYASRTPGQPAPGECTRVDF